jgi:uncharacterized membrane protein (UPF0127 family)
MKISKILGLGIFIGSLFLNVNAIAGDKEFLCSNPAAKVSFNSKPLTLRIACSREQLTQGLMNIRELPENNGMLFIFKDEQLLTFWAKNTYIPIDIAYLNNNLEVVDIYTLKPLDTTIVKSRAKASYALEVNAGWFARNNIKIGDRVEVLKY